MQARKFAAPRFALGIVALAVCGFAHAAGGEAVSAFGASAPSASPALGPTSTLVVDVTGTASYGGFNNENNVVASYFIGANSTVTAVAWDVTLMTYGDSWLSEIALNFTDTDGTAGVYLRPALGSGFSGTASFSGSVNLDEVELTFNVGPDGMLRLQFMENYWDGGTPDGMWNSGTLTFTYASAVPEPASYGLMALGLVGFGLVARRRRSIQ